MDKVVVICGPTATGKTRLALRLAQEFDGELVSADSRQVYVGNDEETGKDLKLVRASGIKVWLYDIVKPGEAFSVSQWRKLAREAINDILIRGKLPIVVGGTGLYIKALTEDLPDVDAPYDAKLRKQMENKTVVELSDYLKRINPQKFASMNHSDQLNPRRLIRAIEIVQRPSLNLREGRGVSYIQIGLTASRKTLENWIRARIKARGLNESFAQKEIAIMKKQLVWFKKQPGIKWYNLDDAEKDRNLF